MTQERNRIISKLQKLMARAVDPASSDTEKEVAGRMIAALMAQHRISEIEIASGQIASKLGLAVTHRLVNSSRDMRIRGTTTPPWVGMLAVGIALFTECRASAVRNSEGVAHIKYMGTPEDTEMAVWLHGVLVLACGKDAKVCSGDRSAASKFRNGWASAVQSRLQRMTAQAKEQIEGSATPQQSNALMVISSEKDKALTAAYGAEGTTTRKRSFSYSEAGFQAGMRTSIPTNRPLANPSSSNPRLTHNAS